MDRACHTNGEKMIAYRIVEKKQEGKSHEEDKDVGG
jgi:hypothetical protein